jgi:hypothetical protein
VSAVPLFDHHPGHHRAPASASARSRLRRWLAARWHELRYWASTGEILLPPAPMAPPTEPAAVVDMYARHRAGWAQLRETLPSLPPMRDCCLSTEDEAHWRSCETGLWRPPAGDEPVIVQLDEELTEGEYDRLVADWRRKYCPPPVDGDRDAALGLGPIPEYPAPGSHPYPQTELPQSWPWPSSDRDAMVPRMLGDGLIALGPDGCIQIRRPEWARHAPETSTDLAALPIVPRYLDEMPGGTE